MHVSVYVCVNSKDILLSVATVHREVHSWGGEYTPGPVLLSSPK